jgi:hypothetical protein
MGLMFRSQVNKLDWDEEIINANNILHNQKEKMKVLYIQRRKAELEEMYAKIQLCNSTTATLPSDNQTRSCALSVESCWDNLSTLR